MKAQLYQINSRNIYLSAVEGLPKQNDKVGFVNGAVFYSSKTVKSFNFSHPNYSYIDTNKLRLSPEWLSFLNSIDTSKIKDISRQIMKGKTTEKLNEMFKRYNSFSVISSAIVSNDYTKAIVSYDYFTARQNMAGGVLLLEKRDNKWIVIELIRLYIS